MMVSRISKTAFIGFGEAGQAFAAAPLFAECPEVAIFDTKFCGRDENQALRLVPRSMNFAAVEGYAEAVRHADLIFSFVTADQALEVARCCSPHIKKDALYLDCNSYAPQSKRIAARVIEKDGGRYIDVAVMAPVSSRSFQTALLVSGGAANAAAEVLQGFGMSVNYGGPNVGQASTVKMLRSVVVKGLEALTAECVLAARRAGVADAVLNSLKASEPGSDWHDRAAYNLERMVSHGVRRAAEMQEAVETLKEIGIPADMAEATAKWQAKIGSLPVVDVADSVAAISDQILHQWTLHNEDSPVVDMMQTGSQRR